MDRFRKKFLEEANEHIQNIESDLLRLEQRPRDSALIENTFRAMHTLKGGGAMFGLNRISELTHNLETIFDHIRSGNAYLSEEILAISFEAIDHLKILVEDNEQLNDNHQKKQEELLGKIESLNHQICKGETTKKSSGQALKNVKTTPEKTYYIYFKPHPDVFDNGTNPLYIIDELVSLGEHIVFPRFEDVPDLHNIIPTKCYAYWEVFLATSRTRDDLLSVFMFVEDDCDLEIMNIADTNLIHVKDFVEKINNQSKNNKKIDPDAFCNDALPSPAKNENQNGEDNTSLLHQKIKGTKISSLRIDSEKVDHFMNLVSELVTTQASLTLFAQKEHYNELNQITENMQKLTRNLRDLAFNIALIPIDQVVIRFQRLVRDLSKELHKDIELVTEGTEIELDKNIIESLTDPILHILRNAVDHGIEETEVRVNNGKPEKGKIHFKAYHSGSNVHILIHDDGAGINPDKIKQKAIANGLIHADANLTKKELYELLFLPGFTTSQNVTGVSGRGVGMDVVKRRISEIRGVIEVDSEINAGTTITIKLPLTLSIIDGLLVRVDKEKFLIPMGNIQKIHSISPKVLENNFHQTIRLDEELLPYFDLREKFGIKDKSSENEYAIIISYEDKKAVLIVDAVIGEYQAVLKSLGKHYKDQEMLSGATILGDGTVALVMDTNMMVNSFINNNALAENQ